MKPSMTMRRGELGFWAGLVLAVLVWSGIGPHDRATWWLEVAPVLVAVPVLWWTRQRFPWSALSLRCIALHAILLCVGGHYTYARVPVGFWVQDLFDLSRNHYDRLGHLAQGFVPALLARELFLRLRLVRTPGWRFTLVTAFCLALSACYELIEWWAALIDGSGATAFLGTQGDPWDTQWDMALAWIGAMAAQLLLGGVQDRQLAAHDSDDS